MRSKEEIEKIATLEREELYNMIRENQCETQFFRGWIACLDWVLEKGGWGKE